MGGAKADRLVPSPADAAIVIIIQLRTITAKQSLQRMPWEKKKGERGIRLSESTDREFHLTMGTSGHLTRFPGLPSWVPRQVGL